MGHGTTRPDGFVGGCNAPALSIGAVEAAAERIVGCQSDPVVRHLLLRDVLCCGDDAPALRCARVQLESSGSVRALAAEQRADGGWGPFHSGRPSRGRRVPCTEFGIERAVALGLDASHPILRRAEEHVAGIVRGDLPFPDRPERNDRWATGKRLFLAATLARIRPDHPAVVRERRLWLDIARATFASGTYDADDEIEAHAGRTGATIAGSYLELRHRYQLELLASSPGGIPPALEAALMRWLCAHPAGIGYLDVPLQPPPPAASGPLDRWFRSHELLSRLGSTWVRQAEAAIAWLWRQRNAAGLWDLGPRPGSTPAAPLSVDWKWREHRTHDWSTRVLIVLRRFLDGP